MTSAAKAGSCLGKLDVAAEAATPRETAPWIRALPDMWFWDSGVRASALTMGEDKKSSGFSP